MKPTLFLQIHLPNTGLNNCGERNSFLTLCEGDSTSSSGQTTGPVLVMSLRLEVSKQSHSLWVQVPTLRWTSFVENCFASWSIEQFRLWRFLPSFKWDNVLRRVGITAYFFLSSLSFFFPETIDCSNYTLQIHCNNVSFIEKIKNQNFCL